MYSLHLQSGKCISSADLQHALGALECGDETHRARMAHMSAIERIEARGTTYSNQDFDVLSAALNFLDAVHPGHELRTPTQLKPGDKVRYYNGPCDPFQLGVGGWLFGEVIGTHVDKAGINPTGVAMATVRFYLGSVVKRDRAIAQLLLEPTK